MGCGSGSSRCCRSSSGSSAIRAASRSTIARLAGDLVRAAHGDRLGASAAGAGLWLRDDRVAAAARLAAGGRLEAVARALARRAAGGRSARMGPGDRRLQSPASELGVLSGSTKEWRRVGGTLFPWHGRPVRPVWSSRSRWLRCLPCFPTQRSRRCHLSHAIATTTARRGRFESLAFLSRPEARHGRSL